MLGTTGKVYITHAKWWTEGVVAGLPIHASRIFQNLGEIVPGEKLADWGWDNETEIFPILEISTR